MRSKEREEHEEEHEEREEECEECEEHEACEEKCEETFVTSTPFSPFLLALSPHRPPHRLLMCNPLYLLCQMLKGAFSIGTFLYIRQFIEVVKQLKAAKLESRTQQIE